MKLILLVLCFFYSSSLLAAGIPVYSAVNHLDQIANHITVLKDAAVQLEKLGVDNKQLTAELQSLTVQYQQFQQQVQNAKRLYGDLAYVDDMSLNNMLHSISDAYSRVEQLDPRNPYFDEQAKSLTYQKYGDPTLRASNELSGNQKSIGRLDAEGETIQKGYDKYLGYEKYQAAQNQLTKARKAQINAYTKQLNGLGDNSELATQQLTAAQINLLLNQQEKLISSVNELNARQERKDQEKRAMERAAYQDKIETLKRKAETVYRVGEEQ